MTEVLDEEHFISGERALQGVKYGALIGTGMWGVSTLIAVGIKPDLFIKTLQESPFFIPHMALATAYFGVSVGLIGAGFNTIRPIARWNKEYIENTIETGKNIYKAFNTIKNADYRRILINTIDGVKKAVDAAKATAYFIARPPVPQDVLEDKSFYLSFATGMGTTLGASVWLACSAVNGIETLFDKLPGADLSPSFTDPFMYGIMNNPIPTIALATTAGLAVSAYSLAFHR